MRKQLLGATALLIGATTVGLGVPPAPSQALAWKTMNEIPFPAGSVTDVEVVSTGDGDAVAAAIISGAVHAYTATDGVWTGHSLVRVDVDANRLMVASNEKGDTAIGWVETVAGDDRVRVARQLSSTSWSASSLMTPSGADVAGVPDLGIDGSGRIIAVATVDGPENDQELFATEWAKGGSVGAPDSISVSDSSTPSLDVNSKGEALVAFNYTGLINNVLTVVRRTPGKGWNVGDGTKNSGNIASVPDVAISENGHGQVIYSVVSNGYYRVETSRVLPTGVALDAEIVEYSNDFTSEPQVDINASGSALFAWISNKDGVKSVRHASAAPGAYPGVAQALPGTRADAQHPIVRVGEGNLRLVQHSGNNKITTHHRNGAGQDFAPTTTPSGFSADTDLDLDARGNAVLVGFTAAGVRGRFLDAAAPTISLSQPGPTTIGLSVPIKWSASDALTPQLPGTDLYMTRARWNQGSFTAPAVIVDGAPGTTAAYKPLLGTTYCFQARVVDSANNGATSTRRCTTVPLDDTSLAGGGWTRAKKSGRFNNTWTHTSKKGRTLTRTGVKAQKLALLASKLPTGGKVRVTWNGTTIRTINLQGKAANKVVLPIITWGNVRSGTLKIVVTSSGKSVRIDGLVVTK
jgi:hypothetical protein